VSVPPDTTSVPTALPLIWPPNSPVAWVISRSLLPSSTLPLPARFLIVATSRPPMPVMSKVAPLLTVTTLECVMLPSFASARVPALIVVAPV
jgi:hypothetical protein